MERSAALAPLRVFGTGQELVGVDGVALLGLPVSGSKPSRALSFWLRR